MPTATFISHSAAETESLGAQFGRSADRGLVIALNGELGAGKTQFVRGLARGLGSPARVHSPTFTLANEYGGGRLKLFLLDLYRLETPEQLLSAGIEDYLPPDGVLVIEWAERLQPGAGGREPAAKGLSWLSVGIEITGESERKIIYDLPGA
jgi:tRNA threonylcarbamoyladenosine biosynthesis protein TsaE